MKIIQSRLEGVPGNLVDPDAVQFASRKVAAVSGDARRALDICRRAVEIAESEDFSENPEPNTPSRRGRQGAVTQSQKKSGRVVISTIKQAINEATSNPLQHYLKALPLGSKMLLAALLARLRRSGIGESSLTDVVEEAKRLCQITESMLIRDTLFSNIMIKVQDDTFDLTQAYPSPRVLAMGQSAMELSEAGIIKVEARNGERTGKIRLNISEDEVKLALKDDPEVRSLGFS
jgi:origin recognition complex subunit 1